MFREQIEMEVNFLEYLLILLSIYKYLRIPWGVPNTFLKNIFIVHKTTLLCLLHLVVTTNISYFQKKVFLGGQNHIPHFTSPSVKSKIELPYSTHIYQQPWVLRVNNYASQYLKSIVMQYRRRLHLLTIHKHDVLFKVHQKCLHLPLGLINISSQVKKNPESKYYNVNADSSIKRLMQEY